MGSVDLLNDLRLVMPEGCIPSAFPMPLIERLSTKARIITSHPTLAARVSSDLASLKEACRSVPLAARV